MEAELWEMMETGNVKGLQKSLKRMGECLCLPEDQKIVKSVNLGHGAWRVTRECQICGYIETRREEP